MRFLSLWVPETIITSSCSVLSPLIVPSLARGCSLNYFTSLRTRPASVSLKRGEVAERESFPRERRLRPGINYQFRSGLP
jgi:hypothetical protein